ncbi:MAG: hypothetical protein LUB59_01200 [Candidatus Gastranaerophilales bacterium]|nr:hypothetical protein [Candidatus Gastranaerophilales bacterium]
MGKAKKRSIVLGKHNQLSNISRTEAISIVVDRILKNESAAELITLFGLSAEELLEAGADYEHIKSLRGIL